MEYLISVVIGFVMYEAYAWLPKISEWLIEQAVCRLPAEQQDRCREEWLANLNTLPNSVVRLLHALSFCYRCTADRISADIFEARFDNIDERIKSLSAQLCCSAQRIHALTMRAAKGQESLKHLERHVNESAGSLRATEVPVLVRVSMQEAATPFETLGHSFVAAISRARALTTIGIERLNARIDEADNLMKAVIEKHSYTIELFRERKLSSKALAVSLTHLDEDLDRLRVLVEEDAGDDRHRGRINEHKQIMDAIGRIIANLNVVACRA